jgi:antilisterial bacteriocin subtilosin biosynthesis protein AlbA
MRELYPFLRPGVKLRQSPSGYSVVDARGRDEYELSESASTIYRKCDGRKTVSAIAEELGQEWQLKVTELVDFLMDAAKRGFVTFSREVGSVPIVTIGHADTYSPHIVSLEVTTSCNIACTYCYGCYGPDKKEQFPFERAESFFDELLALGVRGVELTGGEPFAHPRFADLYRMAFERFDIVAVISNGVLWRPVHFEILEKYRHKAYVQISIDGSNEEVSARVRQKHNTFEQTMATVRRLVELDVLLRVACVVTQENVHDLRNMAQLVKDAGVKMFAMGVADGIGRGSELTYPDGKSLVNYTSPHSAALVEAVAAVNREFGEIMYGIRRVQEEYEKMFPGEDVKAALHNCGAGHSMVAIRANGDVTGCQYMQDRVAHLGNVLEGDVAVPFNGVKSRLMREFYKDHNDPSCMHCSYNGHCANCMVRIYEANRERLVSGKGLCGVVRRNKLDQVFDFSAPAKHNVTGLIQIGKSPRVGAAAKAPASVAAAGAPALH